jgi:hypothetical protein
VHVDVKKLGRIPDGGGWRVHGRAACPDRRRTTGFDYIHSAVDDHSRLPYSEVHPDEKAATCAGFLQRAAAFFATCGIDRIGRVLTDNAWPYRKSLAWRQALADLGAAGKLTRVYRGRRPTARSNASTAPCSTNGPTSGPTPATPSAPPPWQTSCIPTTATAVTPHSAATHRSAV